MSVPFSQLELAPALLKALASQNHTEPTPIQELAIPVVIKGNDILGIAKTGSGKTASYVLPILQQMIDSPPRQSREAQVLVLVPTRELAIQVDEVFQSFIEGINAKINHLAVFGGVSINPQMQALRRINILTATPGRLLDLVDKNAVRLSSVHTLVLDEADKMLNLGFKEELDQILKLIPTHRQNLLFSATLNKEMSELQGILLDQPVVIQIDSKEDEIEQIEQIAYAVSEERKGPLLRYLIKKENLQQVLVFASSAKKADGIVNKLRKNKVQAMAIHGQQSQGARKEALKQFKAGSLRVLVATDLLARGVDINELPCVINYELPRSPKDYIHRIGRTGRADKLGQAISLITPDERPHFKTIQKKMEKRVALTYTDEFDLHGY